MWKVDLLSHFREQGLCGSACPSQTSLLSPSRELHTLSLLCQLPAGVAHLWLLHHEGKKNIASESGGPFTQVKLFSHEGQNSLNENWGRGRGPFTREELSVETHAFFAMEVRIHYMRIGGWGWGGGPFTVAKLSVASSGSFALRIRIHWLRIWGPFTLAKLSVASSGSFTLKVRVHWMRIRRTIYSSKTIHGKLGILYHDNLLNKSWVGGWVGGAGEHLH